MAKPRICFTVLINQFTEHGYIPSVVTEDESGHNPLVGRGELAEPWYWGTDFEQAKQVCRDANHDLGLTDDDVTDIICSSMAAGNRGAARLREVGLPADTDDRLQVQSRLIADGKIT